MSEWGPHHTTIWLLYCTARFYSLGPILILLLFNIPTPFFFFFSLIKRYKLYYQKQKQNKSTKAVIFSNIFFFSWNYYLVIRPLLASKVQNIIEDKNLFFIINHFSKYSYLFFILYFILLKYNLFIYFFTFQNVNFFFFILDIKKSVWKMKMLIFIISPNF